MRGGGTKGAYEVGVLLGMLESLPAEELQWDVVSGISIGGVNAAMLALYEKGDEAAAI